MPPKPAPKAKASPTKVPGKAPSGGNSAGKKSVGAPGKAPAAAPTSAAAKKAPAAKKSPPLAPTAQKKQASSSEESVKKEVDKKSKTEQVPEDGEVKKDSSPAEGDNKVLTSDAPSGEASTQEIKKKLSISREGDFMALPVEKMINWAEKDDSSGHTALQVVKSAIAVVAELVKDEEQSAAPIETKILDRISFSVMVESEKKAITADDKSGEELLRAVLSSSKEEAIEVFYDLAPNTSSTKKIIKIKVTRHVAIIDTAEEEEKEDPSVGRSDGKTEAEFDFEFSALETEGLKQKVLQKAIGGTLSGGKEQGGEKASTTLGSTLFVVVEGEKQLVSGDRLLSEVFTAHLESHSTTDEALIIIVEGGNSVSNNGSGGGDKTTTGSAGGTSRSSNAISIDVVATLSTSSTSATTLADSATAKFSLSFQPEQDNLLEGLKQEVRGELDLGLETKLTLTASVAGVEGQITLVSDKNLREILSSWSTSSSDVEEGKEGKVLILNVEEEKELVSHAIKIACSEKKDGAEEATFTFRYRFDEENALKNLRIDMEEQLDLDSGNFELLFVSELDEEVNVTSDRLLREIFQEYVKDSSPSSEGGKPLKFLTKEGAAGREGATANDGESNQGHKKKKSAVFKASLLSGDEDEVATFTYEFTEGVSSLTTFHQELRGELELFNNEALLVINKGEGEGRKEIDSDSAFEKLFVEVDKVNEYIVVVEVLKRSQETPQGEKEDPTAGSSTKGEVGEAKKEEAKPAGKEEKKDEKSEESSKKKDEVVKTPQPPSNGKSDSKRPLTKAPAPPAGPSGAAKSGGGKGKAVAASPQAGAKAGGVKAPAPPKGGKTNPRK